MTKLRLCYCIINSLKILLQGTSQRHLKSSNRGDKMHFCKFYGYDPTNFKQHLVQFAVSQVCLLKEWIYIFECKNQCHCSLWDFAGIKNCVQSSPSATVLTEWVTNLAQVNLLEEMEQIDQCGGLVHLQSNGAPVGKTSRFSIYLIFLM